MESERLFSGTGKSDQVRMVGDDLAQPQGWLAQNAFSPHPFLRHTNFYILLAAPSQKPQHGACKRKPLPSRKPNKPSSLGSVPVKGRAQLQWGGNPKRNPKLSSSFLLWLWEMINHFALVSHLYNENNSLTSFTDMF